jgi:glutathione synthase
MQKNILFIGDSLSSFKIATDTTYSLIVAANELGFNIFYALSNGVYLNMNEAKCRCRQLHIFATSNDIPNNQVAWYQELEEQEYSIDSFYAVMVRKDPPFDMEYFYLTQILELTKTKVINNSHALRNFNEKLSILNFPTLIPQTLVSKNKDIIHSFIQSQQECVIKPLDLMAGRGIFKIINNDVNYNAIIEASTQYYTQTVMVQKFIPEVVNGDKRVFIVNGKVIDYCLYRIPQNNEIRGNIAAGGRGEVHSLTKSDYTIANEIALWLIKHNILFAGIDIIGEYITEVNITSPTGTRQILHKTGINIPKLLMESI